MKIFDKLEEYILLICFPCMVVLIVFSTFTRYLQLGSFPWAEETARYLMITAAFAGISYGFKMNSHLGLSFFVDRTKGRVRKALEVARVLLNVLFGIICGFQCSKLIARQMTLTQVTPSLHIPMWVVYLPIVAGCLLIVIRSIQSFLRNQAENQEVL